MGRAARSASFLALALALAACSEPDTTAGAAAADAGAVSAPASQAAPPPLPAPAAANDPNPLGLPPRRLKLDAGRRVFTFSDAMLAGARPGSTLILYSATVSGFDGDDFLVEGRTGPAYKVHAGYVIAVPDDPKIKHGDPVLTEWNGVMKHAVITKLGRDRVGVRFTDMDSKTPEAQLKNPRLVKQSEGLQPGNYAALRDGETLRHVLLVSLAGEGLAKKWFALGFGGAAMIVDEVALTPIPVKYDPKPGAAVLAEWVGTLRKATVQAALDQGLFSVRFERAGRPVTLGWGLLMRDAEAPAPVKEKRAP
jgi:hypothetical protein